MSHVIEIYGAQTPTIEVVASVPPIMARSGITPADIANAFNAQNKVVDAGGIDSRYWTASASNRPVTSTPWTRSGNLTIVSRSGRTLPAGEMLPTSTKATRPLPANLMRIDGKPAVGIAISTVPTGNVVRYGRSLSKHANR